MDINGEYKAARGYQIFSCFSTIDTFVTSIRYLSPSFPSTILIEVFIAIEQMIYQEEQS